MWQAQKISTKFSTGGGDTFPLHTSQQAAVEYVISTSTVQTHCIGSGMGLAYAGPEAGGGERLDVLADELS